MILHCTYPGCRNQHGTISPIDPAELARRAQAAGWTVGDKPRCRACAGKQEQAMTYEEYDKIDAIRASRLKLAAKSPLHYRVGYSGPDSPARDFLRAVHAAVLEPDVYSASFGICPDRRTKAGKAWVDDNPDVTAISASDADRVRAIRESILAHPVAGALLSKPGASEVTVVWDDPRHGMACKARIDRLVTDSGLVELDLKGYGTTIPRQIASRVVKNGAHIQRAHYNEGLAVTRDVDPESIRHGLIVYEPKPPYDVGVVWMTHDGALYAGRLARDECMDTIARSRATGEWHGALPDAVDLDLPPWAWGEEEDELMMGDVR